MIIARLFPLWAVLAALAAYLSPDSFRPLLPHVTTLLTVVMFGLGITLTFADFRRVIVRPAPVIAGVVIHYLVMPLAAWLIARGMHMQPELTTGMILVGSVASGTGSTLMVFPGQGRRRAVDHHRRHVDAGRDLRHPAADPVLRRCDRPGGRGRDAAEHPADRGVAGGRRADPEPVRRPPGAPVEPVLPFVSIIAILAIIGAVVAGSQASIASVGPTVLVGVIMHNGLGLLGGYWGGRLLGFEENVCRTLALEVGMQNSGLAATLGQALFLAPGGVARRGVLRLAQPVRLAAGRVVGRPGPGDGARARTAHWRRRA